MCIYIYTYIYILYMYIHIYIYIPFFFRSDWFCRPPPHTHTHNKKHTHLHVQKTLARAWPRRRWAGEQRPGPEPELFVRLGARGAAAGPPEAGAKARTRPRITQMCVTRGRVLALALASGGGPRAPSHTRLCRSGRAPPSPPPRRAPSAAQRAPSHTHACGSGSYPGPGPRLPGPRSLATGPEPHTYVCPALAPRPWAPIGRAAGPESHGCVRLGI